MLYLHYLGITVFSLAAVYGVFIFACDAFAGDHIYCDTKHIKIVSLHYTRLSFLMIFGIGVALLFKQ